MENTTFKQFVHEFLKKFAFMVVMFFISLRVSNDNIYQAFLNYLWILVLGALFISVWKVYVKPKIQNR